MLQRRGYANEKLRIRETGTSVTIESEQLGNLESWMRVRFIRDRLMIHQFSARLQQTVSCSTENVIVNDRHKYRNAELLEWIEQI
jgi:hypothetical protein